MSKFNKDNAVAVQEFNEFRGIDRRFAGSGEGVTKDMVNFRILFDGSLKRRGGMKFVTSFEADIRAIWTGYVKDVFVGYVIAAERVYRLNYDDNGEYLSNTFFGFLESSEGDVAIFYYHDYHFIVDGKKIYILSKNGLREATGYTPLYGKDWPTGAIGEEYEPLNMLTRKARISYVVTDPPNIFLCTKHPIETVVAVFVNGVRLMDTDYDVDHRLGTVNIPIMNPGDKVMLYIVYQSDNGGLDRLRQCTNAAVFGGMNNSRVLLWGNNSSNIFASRVVPPEFLRETSEVYGDEGVLYFTEENDLRVGDGSKCIKGVSRHYDRMLVFTEGETWMADSASCDNESVPIMRINALNGACCESGITRCENDPISVDDGRILRWMSNTDELDDFNAYSISDPVSEMLSKDFFRNAIAFEDKFHGEVLFAKKHDSSGRIYVFEEKNKNWYTYDNIVADGFYAGKNNVGVYRGSELYIFDDSYNSDVDSAGAYTPIRAFMSTYPIDFGLPHKKKRLGCLGMLADMGGSAVGVAFSNDNGNVEEFTIVGKDSLYVDSYAVRLKGERFVRTSMTLEGSIGADQRIYKLAVTAKH